jgi:RND family efflux transporter MFP subunit
MTKPNSPQIRFVARIVVPAAILGTAALLLAGSSWRTFERPRQVRVAPVAVIASQSPQARGAGGIQAPGWIEPAPFAIEARALREGIVSDVIALEGASVAKGDVLVTLEDAAERLAVMRQAAALRLAEADILAKTAAVHATERTLGLALDADRAVREAEALLREAESARAKLAAQIAQAEAREAEARDEHERKEQLVAAGAASAGDVRRLGLRVAALAAETESLRSERSARDARVSAATGDLDAARKNRAELIAETRARDEAKAALAAATAARESAAAMRDEAQLALDRSEVRAPRAGIVMRRTATPGSRVGGESPALLSLYDPASLQVRCDVPLKEAARLSIGLVAEVRVDAMPNRVFRGRVTRIVPESDLQKNTVQCKVAVDEPDAALRPDMLARVRILTDGEANQAEAIAVPVEALRDRDGARARVLVAIPDAGAARTAVRDVMLGAERANGWLEVIDGLAAGDRVVVDPAVTSEQRISPVESPKEATP